ncbi:hypothetical protein VIBNIFTn2_1110021 [Vibrio nigripulchritudo FTn2]|nr:hypothetical protein VIBNIFTn2_1110021 [Vibrio nigripulchritudo FTn2]
MDYCFKVETIHHKPPDFDKNQQHDQECQKGQRKIENIGMCEELINKARYNVSKR